MTGEFRLETDVRFDRLQRTGSQELSSYLFDPIDGNLLFDSRLMVSPIPIAGSILMGESAYLSHKMQTIYYGLLVREGVLWNNSNYYGTYNLSFIPGK